MDKISDWNQAQAFKAGHELNQEYHQEHLKVWTTRLVIGAFLLIGLLVITGVWNG